MLLDKDDSLLLLVDVQEKLAPAVVDSGKFIDRCAWLLKLADKLHVPIVVSEQYPQGLGSTLPQFSPYYKKNACIDKIHFSCMQEPKYTHALRQHDRSQLILIGIEAHVCILQTAIEMVGADFEVFVVVDAVSSREEQDLKYALKRLKNEGVQLVTAEMVFFEWLRKAGSPEFKALSKEFLQ